MKNVALLSVLLWTSLAILFGFVQNVKAQGSSPAFSNPDEPIDVAVNQEFKIVLDANPTTGFLWQLSEPLNEAIVRFVRDNYDIAEVPGLTGGGGKHIWTFRAAGPGQTVISFSYSRPWEKGVPPLKTVRYRINVR